MRSLSGQRREWRYTWNAEDQLVRIDTPDRGTWAYDYDPVGRRTAKRQLAQRDGQDDERGADRCPSYRGEPGCATTRTRPRAVRVQRRPRPPVSQS
ncbi:hypothetical protein [Streptomyces sp. AS02]|uniref:hypothetical protein n=1 Tax=Streptomyces sp. AS02 TaxID=2938946 RepID=UPI0034D6D941